MSLVICSHSNQPFYNREEAGRLLAGELRKWQGPDTVVLGIPRGGVVIAAEIAWSLNAGLDILLAHKMGAPFNPEYAIGAVSEDGNVFLDESSVRRAGADETYIEKEKDRQLAELSRRGRTFRAFHPKVPLRDKKVVITDDGVATGATARAAIWAVRQEFPKEIIAAFPVGAEEALRGLARHADHVVGLRVSGVLGAVGEFYAHFAQVSDEEVVHILKNFAALKQNV